MDRPTAVIEYETILLGRHIHQTGRPRHSGARLDHGDHLVLSRLQAEGPMSVGQLSDAFGLDAATLNRQTAALLRCGLAERIPDEKGGLARKLRITEDGARRLDEARAEIVAGLDRAMAGWAPEDVAAFGSYLRRLNGDIEDLTGRPWPHG
ncbi:MULTISPECIES: MarR family winged helix-turn-helix transcriptional regulator [Kitasatospora]|uniref:DNA-binding MarR family transcriptional regulator n=2 Tax=Kitasatospora TaxID=2063 RepID=A0ABT1IV73_9ACTN|nr:MarR family transcriptional regulator [Kitasatospora paracochleata]MCP2309050.1 DNA-binding MarR family transcriptional regulator [Kitasatospora paracochleata]